MRAAVRRLRRNDDGLEGKSSAGRPAKPFVGLRGTLAVGRIRLKKFVS